MAIAALQERVEDDEEAIQAGSDTYPLDRWIPTDFALHRARPKSSVTDFAGGYRGCYLRIISLHPEWKGALERDATLLAS